ncbi:hypothetical protein [Ornithinimicrobium pratense]|uniref:Uncharacterized protein n=1 Tax=Ornithinimicrobium pratense TaxID=2593973 RepID=A0A5J6V7H1_9MICO|nr:hypothetical protein [Ornithinimicrobium pratense]QFG69785.1 hypothetical protein FY030_14725 [Ornithinimicrobium pratense]
MFSGLDQTALLWIILGLLVVLAGVGLAISMSSSRDVLRGIPLVLDGAEEEQDDEDDDESGTRAG